MRYALIKQGVVDNVIVADAAFITMLSGYDHIEALDTEVEQRVTGPGWLYDHQTGLFSPPLSESVESVRMISRFAFRSRFTLAEKTAIYTAAEQNKMIQAFLDDIQAADDIDLDLPDTVAGVEALEAGGLLAPGRAAEILA